MATHNELGKLGEQEALRLLREKGYQIRHINWYYRHKELDIVAVDGAILVVVEVKTRSKFGAQSASEAMSLSKMRYLIEAADFYLTKFDLDMEVRFDLVAVEFHKGKWELTHIEEAFNAMEV